MIRIFKLLFLLVISQVAFAQAPSNYTNINGRYRWIAGMFDSTFHIPKGTNPSLRTGGSTNAGALFYKTGDSSLYIYTGTQWLKQAGTAGFVPYSGATDTLDMGQFGLKTKFVQFDTSSRAVTDRVLQWSNDNGTLAFGMTNGSTITQNVGLQQFARVKNVQGSQINKGQVVYLYGASGDRAAVKLADNRADSTSSKTLGIAIENIPINGEGFVGTFGTMSGLNLSAYTPGDQLYLDSIPGGLTKTKPQAPYHMVFIGVVERANAGNGLLFTNVQNGYELEELHNVKITSPVNNKAVLIYDSINRLWVDTTVAGAGLAVTSVATNTGTGITGGTITTSGTLAIDTLLISTRAWRQKGIDSLQANINLKVNISDTSSMLSPYLRKADTTAMLQNYVNNVGFGLDKAGQVVSVDTLEMSTRAWRQKGIDSVASLINTRVSGTTNYIPKFTSSSAIGNSTMLTDANGNIIVSSGQTWGTSAGGLNLSAVSDDGYVTTYYDNKNLTLGAGVTSKNRIVIEGQAGGNNINFNVFGSERMRLTSTGLGIGTSSPAEKLHVYEGASGASLPTYVQSIFEYNANGGIAIAVPDNSSAAIVFPTSGNSSYSFIDRSGTNLRFGNNGSERMRIDASGNLGLGVTPSAWTSTIKALQIANRSALWEGSNITFLTNNAYTDGTDKYLTSAAASRYYQIDGAHYWSNAPSGTAGNAISFTQAMTLAASGNLGIGVTNPDSYNSYAYRLVVGGLANSGITIAGDASEGSSNLYFADGTTGDQAYRGFLSYTHSNDYLTIGTSGTTRMTITSGGNVGIATSAPDGKLDVNGTSYFRDDLILYGTKKLYLDSGSDTYLTEVSANTMQFVTGGSERMRITSAGNVGIGTTSPAAKLDVGYVAGAVALRVSRGSSDILDFYQGGGVSYIDASASGGQIAFATVGSERMRITSGGDAVIGTTSASGRLHVRAANATSSNFVIYLENSAATELLKIRNDGAFFTGTGSSSPYNNTSGSAANLVVTSAGSLERSTSSLKYKKNIVSYDKGLSYVMQMNPVYYESINEREKGIRYAGLIAEEIHSLGLTEFVQYAKDGTPDALSYQNMVALLTKAIQEQQAQIEQLKTAIETLKNK